MSPADPTPPISANRPRTNAQLFVGLWALYFLVNALKQTPWPGDISLALVVVRIALVVSAVAVICRLNDARCLIAMLALQVTAVIVELPAMSNCWLFTGMVNLGVLVAAGRAARKSRREKTPFTSESIYAEAVPLLRVSLLTLYLLAALAKYNRDFLNPDLSAAAYFTRLFLESMRINPDLPMIGTLSVWGTLVIETALPIMLFLPRTRRYAIVLGMVFHTILAHNHNLSVFDFNAMLFALYVTFAPTDLLAKVRYSEESKWIFRAVWYRLPVVLSLVAMSLGLIWWATTGADARMFLWRYRVAMWFIIGVSLTIVTAQILFSRDRPDGKSNAPFRLNGRFDWVVLGLILANGLSPYLGLKTGVAYTMFSNLRTEDGYENHLLMPVSLKVFDLQDEPVRVLASSDPRLASMIEAEELVLLYDLRLRTQSSGEHSIKYERNGEIYDITRIADDPLLGEPLPYLARKTLHFRTIPTKDLTPQW